MAETEVAMVEVREARGPVLWALRWSGFAGVFTPWGRIYIVREWLHDPRMIAHERCHQLQRETDGWFRYWWRTFFYIAKHGYMNSPYEIEAREHQRFADPVKREPVRFTCKCGREFEVDGPTHIVGIKDPCL